MNYQASFTCYLRGLDKRPGTVKRHSRALAEFTSFIRRRNRRASIIRQFSPDQLAAYRQYLLEIGNLRPSTVNQRLSGLSAFARFLISRGRLEYNPLELVDRMRADGSLKTREWASYEAVQNFRQEVNSRPWEFISRTVVELLFTGISTRELCALPLNGSIEEGFLLLGQRRVPLHPELRQAIEDYMIIRPLQRGEFLIVGRGSEGDRQPGQIYHLLKRFSRVTGVRVTVRDLRLARFREQFGAENVIKQVAA